MQPRTALSRLGEPANLVTISGFIVLIGTTFANLFNIGMPTWLNAVLLLYAYYGSDTIDGYVARKTGLASRYGEFLDLYVDRLGDCLLALTVLVKSPQYWPAIFVFFMFKISAEHILGRVLGLRSEDHKSARSTEFSSIYTWIHHPVRLQIYILIKVFFFIPVIIGYPIPYFSYVFCAAILVRSYYIVDIFKLLARSSF